jgi:hypothetical protein
MTYESESNKGFCSQYGRLYKFYNTIKRIKIGFIAKWFVRTEAEKDEYRFKILER